MTGWIEGNRLRFQVLAVQGGPLSLTWKKGRIPPLFRKLFGDCIRVDLNLLFLKSCHAPFSASRTRMT